MNMANGPIQWVLWAVAVTVLLGQALAAPSLSGVDSTGIVSIVDLLSQSAQYSKLLHYIRTYDLITTINLSDNATLIAPVNSAFAGVDTTQITRSRLLYHLLDAVVVAEDIEPDSPVVVSSFLGLDGAEDGQNKSSSVPVLITRTKDGPVVNNSSRIVEPDNRASPGRGIIQAVDTLLDLPQDLSETVPEASIFWSLLDPSQYRHSDLTVLAPSDRAFAGFDDAELKYLALDVGRADRLKIVDRHVIEGLVRPQDFATTPIKAKALDNSILSLSSGAIVNDTFTPVVSNIVARQGLVHIYDSLLQHEPLVLFTPRKYLYGIDAEAFVREFDFRGLSEFIDDSTRSQTIFVPSTSSHAAAIKADGAATITSEFSFRYHIAEGSHDLFALNNGEHLMKSEMHSPKLNSLPQRLKAFKSPSGELFVNGNEVISGEYKVGNTSIYVIEGDLDVPPALSMVLGPFYKDFLSLQFLSELNLLRPPRGDAWTILLPINEVWTQQQLLSDYLKANATASREIFNTLIFRTPFYSDSEKTTAQFLDHSKREVEFKLRPEASRQCSHLSIDGVEYEVAIKDILFDSGVAHSIQQLTIPPSVQISPRQLIAAGRRTGFLDLVDGRNKSDVFFGSDLKANYTVLVPSQTVIQNNDFTVDNDESDDFLAMHIIPHNGSAQVFSGEPVRTMADRVNLVGGVLSNGQHYLRLEDSSTNVYQVQVISSGQSTVDEHGNSVTVLYLDHALMPSWVDNGGGIHLPRGPWKLKTPIAILIGAVGGIMLISLVVSGILFVVTAKFKGQRDTESSDSDADDDNSPRRPLLSRSAGSRVSRASARTHSNRSSRRGSADDDQPAEYRTEANRTEHKVSVVSPVSSCERQTYNYGSVSEDIGPIRINAKSQRDLRDLFNMPPSQVV